MKIISENGNVILQNVDYFSLPRTLDCGQAFRWRENSDGSWSGAAKGKFLNIKKDGNSIILKDTSKKDFENIWRSYFDLERDYPLICENLKKDPLLRDTIDRYYGIRILNQDPWEATYSFIISQRNNIKRLKGRITTSIGYTRETTAAVKS